MTAISEYATMERIGRRYVVPYFYLEGPNPANIETELDSTLRKSAPSCSYNTKILVGRVQTSITVVDQMRLSRHKMELDVRKIAWQAFQKVLYIAYRLKIWT